MNVSVNRLRSLVRACVTMWAATVFLAPSWAEENSTLGAMKITPLDSIRVRGDLAERMKLGVKYLDQASREDMWNGFRHKLLPGHAVGMWGADWPGRTLESYARTSMALGCPSSPRYDEIRYGMLAHQDPDGSFPNGEPVGGDVGLTGVGVSDLSNKYVGFWFGIARGLTGMVWANRYEGEQSIFLEPAKMTGDFVIKQYFTDIAIPGLVSGYPFTDYRVIGKEGAGRESLR